MNFGRIIGASLFGGVVMFIWGALAHMVIPIGELGVKGLPGEELIMPAMRFSIKEPGFYRFPGVNEDNKSDEAMKAWEEKYKQGPRGVVIFEPTGSEVMSPSQLGAEFASNVIAAFLAALILSRINCPRLTKVLFATLIGVIGWLSIIVSYWNWDNFPNLFTVGQCLEQTIGWFLSGIAIALVLGGNPTPAAAKG